MSVYVNYMSELEKFLTKSFIEMVRSTLKKHGLTQRDLAFKMGIKYSSARYLMSGRKSISFKDIAKFSIAFKTDITLRAGRVHVSTKEP